MAATITNWVLNPVRSLTMSQPRTRELWCALFDDLERPFPMECVPDQDNITTLKKKIWEETREKIKDAAPHYSSLDLYSPVVQLNHKEFGIDDGELQRPRRMITSFFPKSEDPNVDIVILLDRNAAARKRKRSESPNVSSSPERPIAENQLICPREHTVSKLAAILDDVGIVHVRGTPASGKSCLSLLLRDYYRKEGRKVFLVKKWEDLNPRNPLGSLIELIKKNHGEPHDVTTTSFTTTSTQSEEDVSWVLTPDTVVLLDEAQATYHDYVSGTLSSKTDKPFSVPIIFDYVFSALTAVRAQAQIKHSSLQSICPQKIVFH